MSPTIATQEKLRTGTSAAQSARVSATRAKPLVLWHLLSLDASSVAALWAWFLARANHVRLPGTAVVAMAIAVWMLYASDRLLDTRAIRQQQDLEERHYFHRVHSRAFAAGIVLAGLVLPELLHHETAESLHLYLVLGAMLFAYFVLIHASGKTRRLPKEIAVGVFFSAATFIPTIARQPGVRASMLPAAILFAVLCSLNCLFIYAWEHPRPTPCTHPATRAALGLLRKTAVSGIVAGLALATVDTYLPWPIPAACALSFFLLLVLHWLRYRFHPVTLRATADLCLMTPILFLPFLNQSV